MDRALLEPSLEIQRRECRRWWAAAREAKRAYPVSAHYHRETMRWWAAARREITARFAKAERAVPCSAWLGELEAALTHARKALMSAPEWHENWTAQKEIAIAIRCLETARDSEPRHSPNVGLSEPAGEKTP